MRANETGWKKIFQEKNSQQTLMGFEPVFYKLVKMCLYHYATSSVAERQHNKSSFACKQFLAGGHWLAVISSPVRILTCFLYSGSG